MKSLPSNFFADYVHNRQILIDFSTGLYSKVANNAPQMGYFYRIEEVAKCTVLIMIIYFVDV